MIELEDVCRLAQNLTRPVARVRFVADWNGAAHSLNLGGLARELAQAVSRGWLPPLLAELVLRHAERKAQQ